MSGMIRVEKKKEFSKANLRVKIRRSRANARERNRMHDLNAAMDVLRKYIPIQNVHSNLHSSPQKLSKIETIRLACNYISVMSQMLQEGKSMDIDQYLDILSKNMSQATTNLLLDSLTTNSSSLPMSDIYNKYFWSPDYNHFTQWRNYHDTYYKHLNIDYFNQNININYNIN